MNYEGLHTMKLLFSEVNVTIKSMELSSHHVIHIAEKQKHQISFIVLRSIHTLKHRKLKKPKIKKSQIIIWTKFDVGPQIYNIL